MFGVHQAHPEYPTYPKWSATRWPAPQIEMRNGFKVVTWSYHPVEWFERNDDALARQREFNVERQERHNWDALYAEAETHNAPRRTIA